MKFFSVLVTLIVSALSLGQMTYSFTDLAPSSQYGTFYAVAVNNGGAVAGNFEQTAAVWQNGVYTALPDVGFGAYVHGINADGDVVGTVRQANGEYEAAIWRSGSLSLLGRINGFNSEAMAINEAGNVLIQSSESNYSQGYFYDGSSYRAISLPGYGLLTDLNDNDVACGWTTGFPSSESGGFLWSNGTLTSLGPKIIGMDSGVHAESLNNLSEVVCAASGEGFLWKSGQFESIAGYPYVIDSINDAGDVVGKYALGSPQGRGVIWPDGSEQNKRFLDTLTSLPPGYELGPAVDIANSGRIVGIGLDVSTSTYRSYILNPVPEPATLAVFGLGLLAFIKRRSSTRSE